jgi:hypothetical protein
MQTQLIELIQYLAFYTLFLRAPFLDSYQFVLLLKYGAPNAPQEGVR